MDDMNQIEALIEKTEDNQTRKIIIMVQKCKSVEEVLQELEKLIQK